MFLISWCFLAVCFARQAWAECPTVIGRKEWDAAKVKNINYLINPVDLVVIQHTVTQTCSNDQNCAEIVRELQKIHIDQAYLHDIGPSFLVGDTGKLYEGRGWRYVAIHTPGYNNQSISIAFIGNFNNQDPSPKALDAARALIKCGVEEDRLTRDHKVVVHYQLLSTESPGKKLASKVMSWPDWVSDVSEIKKKADKLESEPIEQQSRTQNDLVLTNPKQIDFLSSLRDTIDKLIHNMSEVAKATIHTLETFTRDINKMSTLFIEGVVSKLKTLKDQVAAAFKLIPPIPGAQKCATALQEKANALYSNTESKAKNCSDQRLKEVNDMIQNLGTLSSDALDYTNIAVENTKNCTEENYGITPATKACLNSVTQQTKSASKIYDTQRKTILASIKTLMEAMPAALELCGKTHLQEATTETPNIALDISKCSADSFLPFSGFGLPGLI